MTEPTTPGLAGSDFLRSDANGVPRIKLPDGRWARLESTEVDGVLHFAASATDIVDEAPPHPGATARDYVNARVAEMEPRDRPESEAETSELCDDLELTVWRAGRDPHMERFGLDDLWRAVWVRWRQKHAPKIAVRNTIDVLVTGGRVAAADKAESILGLMADMDRHWPAVLAKLGSLDGDPAEIDRKAKDALLALGGGVNPALDKLGSKKARELKPIAWPDPVPLARTVAGVLWAAEVGPRLERARLHGPGLPPFTITAVAAIAARGTQTELGLDEQQERAELVRDRSGKKPIGGLVRIAEIDLAVVNRSWLGTLDAHRFMRWIISETHRQKYQLGLARPNEIVLMGGYGALAERLGAEGGGKRAADLRSIVATFSHTSVYVGSILTGLLGIEYDDARRNKPSKLKLTALGPFAPGFFDEWADRLPRGDKQIVPVPLASMLPPLVGRLNEQAAQAQLQQLTLREIRARADEYVTLGGALSIDDRIWADLANEAELPRTLLPEVLDAWHRGNERPAFLVRDGGTYRLGPAYRLEARTIAEGGRRMVEGRRAGRSRRRRVPGP